MARSRKPPGPSTDEVPSDAIDNPPPPPLIDYLTIGFNANIRHLESLAQISVPKALHTKLPGTLSTGTENNNCSIPAIDDSSTKTEALVAIFVPRSDQSALMHAHLPLLVHTASLAAPSSLAIRLIGLPRGAEARLSSVLGIPRTGFIGLHDNAPHAGPLIEMIKRHVPAMEVPWLQEIKTGRYHPVNIKAA